jgi:hypothetical protein
VSTAPASDRRLYVYYRVPPARVAEACRAVRAAQAELCAAQPGLAAELLRRPLPPAGDATLMETWRLLRQRAGAAGAWSAASGVDVVLQARIEAHMAQALAGLLSGPRHVEVFEPCP